MTRVNGREAPKTHGSNGQFDADELAAYGIAPDPEAQHGDAWEPPLVELGSANGRTHDEHHRRLLPAIQDAYDLCERVLALPPEVVHKLLHQGGKMSFNAASKGCKTWTLDALGEAVAYGRPWLGHETQQSRVLLIDLELQEAFCRRRLIKLQEAMNITPEPGRLDVWNLRGFGVSHYELLPKIEERIGNGGYGLIIVDPLYKLYAPGCNENAAADMAALMNSLERLSVTTGAAVAFAAHYSKGNQSGKEAIDRVSGSGVFGRDPDSILSLTAHQEPDCFTLEATLRNFPPIDPVVLRWAFPLFDRDPLLDPTALKKKSGRPTVYSADDVLGALEDGMTATEWQRASGVRNGQTFRKLRDELQQAGRVRKEGQRWQECT